MKAPDTGESVAAINKRADQENWQRRIKPYMQKGAILVYHPKLKTYYTQLGEEFGRYGISITGVRNLEKAGEIILVAAQKYALPE